MSKRIIYSFFVVVSCDDFESSTLSAKKGIEGTFLEASSICFVDGIREPTSKFDDESSDDGSLS